MAREYARVKVAIWADTDFRLLSDRAQALYFRLLSSPTMSLCGVADWRPNRLSALTGGVSANYVREAASELYERGYIVVDDATEEVLVRSFVRHDGLIKTPNIAAAMAKDFAGVASPLLRGVIVHELQRLHDEDPGMKGWAVAHRLLSEPATDPSEMPSGMGSPMPSGMPSGNPSVEALPIPSGNASHIPQPASLNQQPAAAPLEPTRSGKPSRRKPEVPLPDSWEPTLEHHKLADELSLDVEAEARRFRAHADANDRRQRSWNGAFTQWLNSPYAKPVTRSAGDREPSYYRQAPPPTDRPSINPFEEAS